MITIAVSKGYLLKETLKIFKKIGIEINENEDISRKLECTDKSGKYRFLFVRPADVPVYVEYGAADFGIAGKDVLLEGSHAVAELIDLGFGYCRLVVAGLKKDKYTPQRLAAGGFKVATKFVNSAAKYFQDQGIDVELIKLYGSVELAPIDGLSDLIVDLVATGTTLKENGLEVVDTIYETTARLIANSVKIKSRYNEFIALAGKIKSAL
jgi:ATP phosphoribosyltransferase